METLMVILLWCGQPTRTQPVAEINKCRAEKIACWQALRDWSAEDFASKCLVKARSPVGGEP